MFGALKTSLASWGEAHGFTILCIQSPDAERFVVVPCSSDVPLASQRARPWRGTSESALRAHLAATGLSEREIDEGISVSREWATTITGSGSVLWPLQDSD